MTIERITDKVKPCTYCALYGHTAWKCPRKPRKPLVAKARLKQVGKQGKRYRTFRNTEAYPYLVMKFGEKCVICGKSGTNLDVDHIQKRGSHPELKYELSNLQLLCRTCHNKKDNE